MLLLLCERGQFFQQNKVCHCPFKNNPQRTVIQEILFFNLLFPSTAQYWGHCFKANISEYRKISLTGLTGLLQRRSWLPINIYLPYNQTGKKYLYLCCGVNLRTDPTSEKNGFRIRPHQIHFNFFL